MELLPLAIESLSKDEIDTLYGILKHAYATSEVEIWGENYARISREEFIEKIKDKKGIGAKLNHQWVGSIFIQPRSNKILSFGLLSASFQHSGNGIGKSLVNYVEEYAFKKHFEEIQLEVLRPKDLVVPFKQWLADWYLSMGYQKTKEMTFLELEKDKVEKSKRLQLPVIFDRYSKKL